MIIRQFPDIFGTLKAVPLHPPPGRPMMGGDFTPWTEFYWGGNDGGGLEPAGGGIFGQASGTRGSPPSTENPVRCRIGIAIQKGKYHTNYILD